MRFSGPLTQRDRDAVRAMRAALQRAAELVEPTLQAFRAAGKTLTPVLVQLARAAALVEAFDAQPRHRELPARDDVIEWLDRHVGEPEVLIVDDPVGRPAMDADAQARAVAWWAEQVVDEPNYLGATAPDIDRPGAPGRYSHTGGWLTNWGSGVG